MIEDVNIPKIIHYCWFGGNKISENEKKCIHSWKKFFPDYEIRRWDETNFDINTCDYVKEAYGAKKWAYVSDYARFWILYRFGGIYFDTDVEVIRSFDDIISRGSFLGKETGGDVAPGLGLGVIPGLGLFKEILDGYEHRHYIHAGIADERTVVDYMTEILRQKGYRNKSGIQKIEDIYIYPEEFFCPMNHLTGEISITKNTRSIHYYTASWYTKKGKKWIRMEQVIRKTLGPDKSKVIIQSKPWVLLRMLYCNGYKETMVRIKMRVGGIKN